MDTRRDPFYPDAIRPTVFADGIEFQDFICHDLATRHHIILQNLSSKKYQFQIGENLQGFEIKLDTRCTDTNRLSIETAEKSRAANANFVPSGIYRDDNAWLYIQGNYHIYFVFAKKLLVNLHRVMDFGRPRYERSVKDTIETFYLPFADATKYAALVIDLRGPAA